MKNTRHHSKTSRSRGFSLIELLSVVSVMALLGTLIVPSLSRLVMGENFTRSLITLSNSIEKAQAYAVGNNTYTIVAFSEPDAEGKVAVAIFGSRDGSPGVSDLTKNSGAHTVLDPRSEQTGSLVVLERPAILEGVRLEDTLPGDSSLTLGSASTWSKNGASFTYKDRTYTRALQFTPGGEARISTLLPQAVRVIAVPVKGTPANPVVNGFAASAVQVAGLTGSVSVVRPGAASSL